MKTVGVASLFMTAAVAASFYDLTAIDIDGKAAPLSEHAGYISLVVNVATY